MGSLGEAKTLGGIGSILLFIPGVSIVGLILILVATKYIADDLGDGSIFDNMIYAVVTAIIGTVAGVGVFFTGWLFSVFTFGGSLVLSLLGLAAIWVFFIVSSLFIRRSYDTMAARLHVDAFKTAGALWFVGALLTIVFVGFIVLAIAFIFQTIAFFSIKEGIQPSAAPPPAGAVPQAGTRFCAYCGTQLSGSAAFCPKCGAKQGP